MIVPRAAQAVSARLTESDLRGLPPKDPQNDDDENEEDEEHDEARRRSIRVGHVRRLRLIRFDRLWRTADIDPHQRPKLYPSGTPALCMPSRIRSRCARKVGLSLIAMLRHRAMVNAGSIASPACTTARASSTLLR